MSTNAMTYHANDFILMSRKILLQSTYDNNNYKQKVIKKSTQLCTLIQSLHQNHSNVPVMPD